MHTVTHEDASLHTDHTPDKVKPPDQQLEVHTQYNKYTTTLWTVRH